MSMMKWKHHVPCEQSRRCFIDEDTGSCFFESPDKSLDRRCRENRDKVETMNRGKDILMLLNHKRIEEEREINAKR